MTHAGDHNDNVNLRANVRAEGEDPARDQRDARLDDHIHDARDDVLSRVDDRRHSRWYDAATGQKHDEAHLGDEAAARD